VAPGLSSASVARLLNPLAVTPLFLSHPPHKPTYTEEEKINPQKHTDSSRELKWIRAELSDKIWYADSKLNIIAAPIQLI